MSEGTQSIMREIEELAGLNTLSFQYFATKYPKLESVIEWIVKHDWLDPYIAHNAEKSVFSFSWKTFPQIRDWDAEVYLNFTEDGNVKLKYKKREWQQFKETLFNESNLELLVKWVDNPSEIPTSKLIETNTENN